MALLLVALAGAGLALGAGFTVTLGSNWTGAGQPRRQLG